MRTLFKKVVVYLITWEARAVIRKYKPRIVCVVGSVGKTSTKDAIYSVVATQAHTRKSQKSFNSELGLPLTILGVPNGWNNPLRWIENIFDGLVLVLFSAQYPKWLVLEVGADRPGDISSLASWLPVDIAVITRLPEVPVHVEFFDSPEAVVAEKASIINALIPSGTLVLYGDDEKVKNLSTKVGSGVKVVTFGTGEESTVHTKDVSILYEEKEGTHKAVLPLGMQADVAVGDSVVPVRVLGALGVHALMPILAGAAVGQALNVPAESLAAALAAYTPPQGRMRILPGIKDTLVIDDTYNSSPAAVTAALDALKLLPKKTRRIAVLGDMMELGKYSVEAHRNVGTHAADCVDILLTVGVRARDIAQGALDAGLEDDAIFQYEHAEKAGEELQNMLKEGDCVLVKGSQSMRMEHVVEEIMAEPARARELLVRQDAEWKRR